MYTNKLSKQEKLKGEKVFQLLFANKQFLVEFPIKLIYTKLEQPKEYTKVSFTVPKSLINKAVIRNKIKRLLKEVYRTNKHLFPKSYALLFVYIDNKETINDNILKSFQNFSIQFSKNPLINFL